MAFNEYPKKMIHPQHALAVFKPLTPEEQATKGLFAAIPQLLSPERYADVTVSNLMQEKEYASKGYRPANNANAAEYDQAILDQKPCDGYVLNAYPKWKYSAIEIPVVVQNAAEETALGDGWHDSPQIASEDDLPEEIKETVKDAAKQKVVKPKAKKKASKKAASHTGVARHGLGKLDKRSREYKESQKPVTI
jgi:hypothetical protein